MSPVRCYEVTLPHLWPEWRQEVNARSAGEARNSARVDLREAGMDITFADLRVRVLGPARSSERLERVAKYRGRPEFVVGARVVSGSRTGVIVGADECANFVVALDGGGMGSFHPGDLRLSAAGGPNQ